jgi:putative oxidoreductase
MLRDIGTGDILALGAVVLALYLLRDALRRLGIGSGPMIAKAASRARTRHGVLLLEFVELLLAAVFLIVGRAKLTGRSDMVQLFRDIGVGQWFRYATGVIELAGGALLAVPLLAGASALILGGVMIVATLVELFVLHRPPIAALACLCAHTYVAWTRLSTTGAIPTAKPPNGGRQSIRARSVFPARCRTARGAERRDVPNRATCQTARSSRGRKVPDSANSKNRGLLRRTTLYR